MLSFLSNSIFYFAIFGIIFAIAALGALFSERVGIVNIAIDGFMVLGAAYYCLFGWLFGALSPWWQPLIFLISSFISGLFGLLFYWFCVKLKINHAAAGIATLSLTSTVAISILIIASTSDPNSSFFRSINWIFLRELNLYQFLDESVDRYKFSRLLSFNIFLAIVVILIAWFSLEKTSWGLRLKAIGENPKAAHSVGIEVDNFKKQASFISAFLAAIAGQIFVTSILQSIDVFTGSVGGLGFISISLLILGRWKILKVVGLAFLFGFFYSFAQTIQVELGSRLETYSYILLAFPFLITILFSIISSLRIKKSKDSKLFKITISHQSLSSAPEYLGKHYNKESRG